MGEAARGCLCAEEIPAAPAEKWGCARIVARKRPSQSIGVEQSHSRIYGSRPVAGEIGPKMREIRKAARCCLELPDCLIGAVAVRLHCPLVTGNTEDFEAIQRTGIKLTIRNWREP